MRTKVSCKVMNEEFLSGDGGRKMYDFNILKGAGVNTKQVLKC